MELRHLRYFVAVAEELSFTRAARALHIAQPPLSQQIRDLEQELGVRLFHRTRHHVELTAAGQQFLLSARSVLARAGEAVEKVRRAARGEEGELRLGFVSTAMFEDTLPELVRDFRGRYPAVRVRLLQLSSVQQAHALVEGSLDAGFLRPPLEEPGLEVRTLVRESLMLALPSDHRLVGAPRVRLRDLARDPWVAVSRGMGAGFHQQTLELCLRAGFTPEVAMEAGEIQTVVGLVAAGIGVALVPSMVTSVHRRGVVYVELGAPRATVELAIAYRRERPAPVLENLLRLVESPAP